MVYKWYHNMAQTHCMLDKQGYMLARACTIPRARPPAGTHTHTQNNMQYLLLFYIINGFVNAPQCYVIHILYFPFFTMSTYLKCIARSFTLYKHTLFMSTHLPNRASIEQVIVVFIVFSIYTINHSVLNNINCIRNTDNKGKFHAITHREDTQEV